MKSPFFLSTEEEEKVTTLPYAWASQVAQWLRIHPSSRRYGFDPWVRKIPWSRKWQPTQVFFSGKSHGQRSLEGYSPWGCKQLNMT